MLKHLFIVNNTAGGGKKTMPLIPRIEAYFAEHKQNYEIVSTTCKGDATKIARAAAEKGEPIRIYSCGGDGTLHEVVNGIACFDNVELGVFPCGTGNDYVSTFGDKEDFMNIDAQVNGGSIEVDLINTDGIYSINQCSMGFDGAVADNVRLFKSKPLISGNMAYILSVLYTLAGKIGNKLTITVDGNKTFTGSYLFAVAAKGKYHGGGMMNAPEARPDSRSLNFMLVREVSRVKFLTLFPKYIKGKHLNITDVITNAFGSKIHIVAQRPLPVALDGEIIYSDDITSEIVPRAVKFIVPTTVAVKKKEHAGAPSAQAVGASAK